MGFFADVAAEVSRRRAGPDQLTQLIVAAQASGADLGTLLRRWLNPPTRKADEYLKSFGSMPWLRATLHKAASTFASVQIVLRDKRDKKPVEDHPALALLDRPNARWPGTKMRYIADTHQWLRGEAFWIIERARVGLPGAIFPLQPGWVTEAPPLRDRPFKFTWYGTSRVIEPERMLWFSEPNPADPLGRGLGTVEALAEELDSDSFAAQWNKQMLFNRGVPEILVSLKGATADEVTEMRDEWLAKHAGPLAGRKPAFTSAEAKVERLTETMVDMDFLNMRKFNRDTTISVVGIPPELVGVLQASNRATIDAALVIMTKFLVVPRIEGHVETLNLQYLPLWPNTDGLEFGYVNPVPDDVEFLLKKATEGVRGTVMRVNEGRKVLGLDPDPNGDVYMMPALMIPTADLSGDAASAAPAPAPKAGFARAYDAGDAVAALLAGRLANRLVKLLRAVYVETILRHGKEAVEIGGAEVQFLMATPAVQTFLRARSSTIVGAVEDVARKIRDQLAEGAAAGDSLAMLRDRVTKVFAEAKGYRAERIARTEVVAAANFGAVEGFRQSGVVERKQWATAGDEKVRETHAEAEGQVVDLDEAFEVGDAELDYPGDPSGPPEEIINCRCVPLAVFEGEERSRLGPEAREAWWRAFVGKVAAEERAYAGVWKREWQAVQRAALDLVR